MVTPRSAAGLALSDEQALGVELLEILWSAYLLRHHTTGSNDAVEALRSLKILHLLSDDVVLRLCKLRDRDARSLTFHQVLKIAGRKRLQPHEATLIGKRITEFVSALGNLVQLRNKHIAHTQKGHSWWFKSGTDITHAIKLAVEITDQLLGERCEYRIAGLDLRDEVLGKRRRRLTSA